MLDAELNQTRGNLFWSWWMTIDRYMLAATFIIIAFSIIMVTTASPAVAERIGLHSFYFIQRQLVYLFLGVTIMLGISFLGVEDIKKISFIGFIIFLILLILVLFIGEEIKGSKRWVSLGFISIQPSEFIKPIFSIVTASILIRRYADKNLACFKISTFLYLVLVGLLAIQPDLGMVITISAIWGTQMFLAGLSMIWIIFLGLGGVIGLFAAYTFLPHVTVRINSFLDPDKSENYQIKKSIEAFRNGGVYGTGPGEGVVKQHLPDSHTDFIFAVVGEELGMIVGILVIFIFAFIVIRGLFRIYKVGDLFSIIATTGLLMQIGFQAVVNIGVTLHLLPTKGISLAIRSQRE
ncbi:MAG: putative peptidoglycan glycosyltransferase FtsW [Pseudomonadota bacterium]